MKTLQKTILISSLLLLAGCQNFRSNQAADHPCNSNEYKSIQVGQQKDRILDLMGEPDEKLVKSNPDENLFYQGESEKRIKEGWVYRFENGIGVEVYFEEDGEVFDKNCGMG